MAPREWLLSRVCEEFNCPPTVALEQDASDVFAIMGLRAYAHAYSVVMDEQSTDESIGKAGIPKELVTRVMDNAKRQLRGKRGGGAPGSVNREG